MAVYRKPFFSAGGTLIDLDFIGREDELRVIKEGVVDPPAQKSSLSFVGLPRIGKSWLMYKALLSEEQKAFLHARKIMPIKVDVSYYQQTGPVSFFRDLVKLCYEELDQLHWANRSIYDAANLAASQASAISAFEQIRRFFVQLREVGIWTIFILDKFDSAATLFGNDSGYYQRLRDMAYEPEWPVSLILLSRRELHHIEVRGGLQSSLEGVVSEYHLAMFKESDMAAYFQRLGDARLEIVPQQQEKIISHCGRHPYLLGLLGKQLVETHSAWGGRIDLSESFRRVDQKFVNYYEKVFQELQNDGLLAKLIQILFGPVYGLQQEDIDILQAYGVIRPNPKWSDDTPEALVPFYSAFSTHFLTNLQSRLPAKSDISPQLETTEQHLQRILLAVPPKPGMRRKGRERQGPLFTVDKLSSRVLEQWLVYAPLLRRYDYADKVFWQECVEVFAEACRPLTQQRIDASLKGLYRDTDKLCGEIQELSTLWQEGGTQVEFTEETLQEGMLLWGRYRIEKVLEAGHSRVAKAWDENLKTEVAIKLLRVTQGSDYWNVAPSPENLLREARILIKLNHSYISRVMDVRDVPPAMITQWVEGTPLETLLEKRRSLPVEEVVKLGIQLANILSYVHAHPDRITHRDIKPQNIILNAQNEPVLIDFDVARSSSVHSVALGANGTVFFVGSPRYSAPEQFTFSADIGPPTDIFSLGVVLYEALVAHVPYEQGNKLETYGGHFPSVKQHKKIPAPLHRILCAMLHQNPTERPTAEQLGNDLQQCLILLEGKRTHEKPQ